MFNTWHELWMPAHFLTNSFKILSFTHTCMIIYHDKMAFKFKSNTNYIKKLLANLGKKLFLWHSYMINNSFTLILNIFDPYLTSKIHYLCILAQLDTFHAIILLNFRTCSTESSPPVLTPTPSTNPDPPLRTTSTGNTSHFRRLV